jgi:hypothetical protein
MKRERTTDSKIDPAQELAPDDYEGMFTAYPTLSNDNQPMIQYKMMKGKSVQDIIKWHLKREARKQKATEKVVGLVKPIDESIGKVAATLDARLSAVGESEEQPEAPIPDSPSSEPSSVPDSPTKVTTDPIEAWFVDGKYVPPTTLSPGEREAQQESEATISQRASLHEASGSWLPQEPRPNPQTQVGDLTILAQQHAAGGVDLSHGQTESREDETQNQWQDITEAATGVDAQTAIALVRQNLGRSFGVASIVREEKLTPQNEAILAQAMQAELTRVFEQHRDRITIDQTGAQHLALHSPSHGHPKGAKMNISRTTGDDGTVTTEIEWSSKYSWGRNSAEFAIDPNGRATFLYKGFGGGHTWVNNLANSRAPGLLSRIFRRK